MEDPHQDDQDAEPGVSQNMAPECFVAFSPLNREWYTSWTWVQVLSLHPSTVATLPRCHVRCSSSPGFASCGYAWLVPVLRCEERWRLRAKSLWLQAYWVAALRSPVRWVGNGWKWWGTIRRYLQISSDTKHSKWYQAKVFDWWSCRLIENILFVSFVSITWELK